MLWADVAQPLDVSRLDCRFPVRRRRAATARGAGGRHVRSVLARSPLSTLWLRSRRAPREPVRRAGAVHGRHRRRRAGKRGDARRARLCRGRHAARLSLARVQADRLVPASSATTLSRRPRALRQYKKGQTQRRARAAVCVRLHRAKRAAYCGTFTSSSMLGWRVISVRRFRRFPSAVSFFATGSISL